MGVVAVGGEDGDEGVEGEEEAEGGEEIWGEEPGGREAGGWIEGWVGDTEEGYGFRALVFSLFNGDTARLRTGPKRKQVPGLGSRLEI